eukprot:297751-Pleurochrysis_carterae.AAC.4
MRSARTQRRLQLLACLRALDCGAPNESQLGAKPKPPPKSAGGGLQGASEPPSKAEPPPPAPQLPPTPALPPPLPCPPPPAPNPNSAALPPL